MTLPSDPTPSRVAPTWSARWAPLARAAGILPGERLLLALSGGADSVLLLHLLSAASPPVALLAVHVDHGLRGEESRADAGFCERLSASLGVPFRGLRVEVSGGSGSLEARARRARYEALVAEARASGHRTILTGHHSDDALETLLQRWIRGTELSGLRGPHRRLPWSDEPSAPAVQVVRPLHPLRREEVRRLLADRGLTWREDGSNGDPRFARNRIRHRLLPLLGDLCGPESLENLRAFGEAIESFEDDCAAATAHLAWEAPPHALATHGAEITGGGRVPRGALTRLSPPLRRRALWRLLTEGLGSGPSRGPFERVLADLERGRNGRHTLPGGWTLQLRSAELSLRPPRPPGVDPGASGGSPRQASLPFPGLEPEGTSPGLDLPVPGIVTLPDGRRLSAERWTPPPGSAVPRVPGEVELDAAGLTGRLQVRWPRSGDRFHGLGAPGSKPLRRYLADRGIPREDRPHVPLVVSGSEILWIAGLGPAEPWKVLPGTRERLRLALHGGAPRGALGDFPGVTG